MARFTSVLCDGWVEAFHGGVGAYWIVGGEELEAPPAETCDVDVPVPFPP
jgi:hypothetical protein